ncbi:DNA cytosine methyltransferase [Neolewinella lacunae]|uniref:DNA (cytosine-5-)-methyltransferase n=1 Tax=Neolewinella lacunae TaxID=1517758 RepID=A0A923PLD6_9BACT|nr:DNA cytosine methyltransferase [Neolewinella lacunae]MBC6995534.1 DNA cytosine methyltransferase [Neolewinella lacunae]MDN3635122.1 DNA cytosine methyltransferase [Neolewinella lacunae]
MKNLVAIDFFCGGGGMTYGLRNAGIDVLAGIDFDESCRQTYTANNPLSKFINIDVSKMQPKDLQKHVKIRRRQRNLILVGCTPCQFWTLLNTNKSKSEKSKNLLDDFGQFVEYYLPGYILLENVPGILNRKDSPLSVFLTLLDRMKYKYDFKVINAKNYSIPQSRKRFILIASRTKKITVKKSDGKGIVTVRSAIGGQNIFKNISSGSVDLSPKAISCLNLSEKNIERLKLTPKDGGNRMAWKDDDELQINAYRGKDNYFRDVYGRMFWDKPSPTITTKFLSISNGRFAHPEENRGLTVREGAILQTFPQTYKFDSGSLALSAKIIGNAVPPKLATFFGNYIKEVHNN